jgi:predicted MFS family arabinose efflux permease
MEYAAKAGSFATGRDGSAARARICWVCETLGSHMPLDKVAGPRDMSWRLVAVVLLPFTAAYFMSVTFRMINAVIAPDLVRELELGARDLGFLTATYFLAFASFQMPLGVLLDRYGARRVQACLISVAALGAVLFSLGTDLSTLALGRGLIGLGVSGALMAGYKQISDWFPLEKAPLLYGLFTGLGSLGALVATAPAQAMVDWVGWRGLLAALAGATVMVALSILAIVPERPRANGVPPTLTQQIGGFGLIFRDALFWRIAPITIVCFGAGTSIQGLWAAPWLSSVAGLDRAAVADQLFMMAVALAVGSALSGVVAELVRRAGIGVIGVVGGGAVLFMTAQLGIVLGWVAASPWLWIAFSACYNAMSLSYAALSQHFPGAYSGRAYTGLNVLAGTGAFAFQFAIGAIIELWPLMPAGGFDPAAFQVAFGAVLALQAAALTWLFISRARIEARD